MPTVKTLLFGAVLSLGLAVSDPLPARAELTDLLDMSEQFDKIEKQDFNAALGRAASCTAARNFDCAEKELAKAAKATNSAKDRQGLAVTWQKLANEKQALLDEQRRSAEEAEQQRIAAVREAERQQAAADSGGFQWGKAAAMMAGAGIGGIGKLSAEVQTKVITGIIKDSMAGQEGMGNLNQVSAAVKSEPTTRQAVRQAKQAANQQNPHLAKLGGSANRKAGIGGQPEKQPVVAPPLEVYDRNGLVGGEPAVVPRSAEVWHDEMRTLELSGRSVLFATHEQNIPGTVLHARVGSRAAAEEVWTSQGGKVTSYSGCGACGPGSTITVVVEFKHITDTHNYIRDK